jgi:hypothetical protein
MQLSQIPTKRHPMSLKRYDRLRREIESIEDSLRGHGYHEIADDVRAGWRGLQSAWDSIQMTERLERAERGELLPWEDGYAEQVNG